MLAVASSTALILLFGEVIPQGEFRRLTGFSWAWAECSLYCKAICSRYGLAIGAASTPIMKVLVRDVPQAL